jgi:hypothetical protein
MNHTTHLRETRAQKADQEYSTIDELRLEETGEDGGRASGE